MGYTIVWLWQQETSDSSIVASNAAPAKSTELLEVIKQPLILSFLFQFLLLKSLLQLLML